MVMDIGWDDMVMGSEWDDMVMDIGWDEMVMGSEWDNMIDTIQPSNMRIDTGIYIIPEMDILYRPKNAF